MIATTSGSPIKLDQISVDFATAERGSPRRILNQLDMEVAAGSIVAILGPSGCGKSTLLRVIAGLQSTTTGHVDIGGKSISESRDAMAFVFQEPALLPWRTVLENVCLPFELRKTHSQAPNQPPSQDHRHQVRHWLDVVGLTEADHSKFPAQLSGGMKMRASLARAMVTDPSLILLDEPFAALDDQLRWRLNEMLLSFWERTSPTILFVTHNIAEAIFLSRRIAVMHQGKIAEWIENPLPEHREPTIRSAPEFAQLYGQVSNQLAQITTP